MWLLVFSNMHIVLRFLMHAAEVMVQESEAKTCLKGYPWIAIVCIGGQVGKACWDECQKRHGPEANADCRGKSDLTITFCKCFYPC